MKTLFLTNALFTMLVPSDNSFWVSSKTLGGSAGKESACNEGDQGSTPKLGRQPGERNGNPPHILAWEILRIGGGAWWATVHGVKELDTTERPTLSLRQWPKCFFIFTILSLLIYILTINSSLVICLFFSSWAHLFLLNPMCCNPLFI